jgi:hypothetical protein
MCSTLTVPLGVGKSDKDARVSTLESCVYTQRLWNTFITLRNGDGTASKATLPDNAFLLQPLDRFDGLVEFGVVHASQIDEASIQTDHDTSADHTMRVRCIMHTKVNAVLAGRADKDLRGTVLAISRIANRQYLVSTTTGLIFVDEHNLHGQRVSMSYVMACVRDKLASGIQRECKVVFVHDTCDRLYAMVVLAPDGPAFGGHVQVLLCRVALHVEDRRLLLVPDMSRAGVLTAPFSAYEASCMTMQRVSGGAVLAIITMFGVDIYRMDDASTGYATAKPVQTVSERIKSPSLGHFICAPLCDFTYVFVFTTHAGEEWVLAETVSGEKVEGPRDAYKIV